jgi:hypothetical protein
LKPKKKGEKEFPTLERIKNLQDTNA